MSPLVGLNQRLNFRLHILEVLYIVFLYFLFFPSRFFQVGCVHVFLFVVKRIVGSLLFEMRVLLSFFVAHLLMRVVVFRN